MMDEEDTKFREIRDQLADDGITVFIAKTPEEGLENLSLINIDALIYQGDFNDNPQALSFIKDHAKKFPVILLGELGKKDVPSDWLNSSDVYISLDNAKRELAQACFGLIENKKSNLKAA
jgi:hypothetical protein